MMKGLSLQKLLAAAVEPSLKEDGASTQLLSLKCEAD